LIVMVPQEGFVAEVGFCRLRTVLERQ